VILSAFNIKVAQRLASPSLTLAGERLGERAVVALSWIEVIFSL
jgi:hypothetical protein